MRVGTASCLVLAAAVGLVLGGPAPSALGLSCASHTDGSPESILAGTEQLVHNERFFDKYDFAVVGKVTTVTTDSTPGSATYGDTSVSVEVMSAFGVDTIDQTLSVFEQDPGWMAGYPFEPGRVYFIPLLTQGPDGEANFSFVCDPIMELDATRAEALPLLAMGSIAVAQPPVDGEAAVATTIASPSSTPTTEAAPATSNPIVVVPTPANPSEPSESTVSDDALPRWLTFGVLATLGISAIAALVAWWRRAKSFERPTGTPALPPR
jgi:hypothetical protein